MKKDKFYIVCRNNAKHGELEAVPKEGYCETLIDDEGHTIDFTLYYIENSKEPKWILSEKTTGMSICFGRTRKEAIDVLREKHLNFVYNMIPQMELYKRVISKAYENQQN